ncbi:MAG: A/G-specific adenine glycosylase [Gemmatimonadetes bacterium]|nr:A/G-specific adenine glycosylase [Gemmatimonadota bacterium]
MAGSELLADAARVELLRARLLAWYGLNKRQLPWRDVGDPYQVWVSEIMLQQTRVEQMRGYFERFVAAFPTLEALAESPEEAVLKAWEGLGYYARARNLQAAAKKVVAELDGQLPRTPEQLGELPGIGPYTAAAVSSIAFDGDHPVLDGNVTRVLCRLLLVEEDPRRSAVKTRLIAAGERLLARGRAGDFNQALMELGARVCTPSRPRCGDCPLAEFCAARRELDDPACLPVKKGRKKRPHYEVTAGLIWKGGRLLIARRPAGGMLGGLWEFPGGKREKGESCADCLRREIREELDFDIEVGDHLVSVDHGYSHFTITLHAFEARWAGGEPRAVGCDDWKWVGPEQLGDYPMPRADRRVLERLGGSPEQGRMFSSLTEEKIRGG